MKRVKGLSDSESTFMKLLLHMLYTYKFSFRCPNLDTKDIQNKTWRAYYLEKELFTSYDMDYSIEKRKRMSQYSKGWGKNKVYFKKEVEIDWRETIYNVKVIISKHSSWPKVTFKVKLTPKEAYILGKAFEGSWKPHFYDVTYKKVEKGQHGC